MQDFRNNSATNPIWVEFSAQNNEQIVLLALNPAKVYGGNYIFTQIATGYGSVILEILAPDGTTWVPLITKTAPDGDGGTALTLGSGAQVRLRTTGVTTVNAKLARVPA